MFQISWHIFRQFSDLSEHLQKEMGRQAIYLRVLRIFV